ncbi:MAG: sodium:proton antiporter, partial [Verrucomicrobia bacterium]|nr:sodium:proton antiporter [Verrucomicrobiota bacterium]
MATQCWKIWLTGVGLLLLTFYILDSRNFRRAPREVRTRETAYEHWRFQGLHNLSFLALVLGAVLVNHPPYLREALMFAAALGSYVTTRRAVHEANDFNFQPIKEVAILFAGIFATMMPALDWLQVNASQFGHPTAGLFFWGSGALSSVLDNAPTYLSFLSSEIGAFVPADAASAILAYLNHHNSGLAALPVAAPHVDQIRHAIVGLRLVRPGRAGDDLTLDQIQMGLLLGNPVYARCLRAISIGSVFFGANTYIGNGPNFMVKAIADQQKAKSPTFLGYIIRFSIPFMLPMLLVVWLLFFYR